MASERPSEGRRGAGGVLIVNSIRKRIQDRAGKCREKIKPQKYTVGIRSEVTGGTGRDTPSAELTGMKKLDSDGRGDATMPHFKKRHDESMQIVA